MNRLKHFWNERPVLANWLFLAVGMVILLYFFAPRQELLPTQWAALVGATIALAGLCAWIISWE